jgi:hypothetical protein
LDAGDEVMEFRVSILTVALEQFARRSPDEPVHELSQQEEAQGVYFGDSHEMGGGERFGW